MLEVEYPCLMTNEQSYNYKITFYCAKAHAAFVTKESIASEIKGEISLKFFLKSPTTFYSVVICLYLLHYFLPKEEVFCSKAE